MNTLLKPRPEPDQETTVHPRSESIDRAALASLLAYCRMEAERQGLQFSAYLINMSLESLGSTKAEAAAPPAIPGLANTAA